MGALTSYAQFKSLVTAARRRFSFTKNSVTVVAGRFESSFLTAPLAGTTPTTAVVLDRTTAGNLHQIPQPFSTGGSNLWIAELELSAAAVVGCTAAMLIDRLSHQGGLSGTVTTEQTTNLPTAALTRYTSGAKVMAAIQIYTAIGATPVTVTIRYTNQAGTANQVSQPLSIPASLPAETVLIFALADGDTGVRSVEGLTLSGTTGTAGNFGVVLFMPLAMFPPVMGQFADSKPIRNNLIGGGFWMENPSDDACYDVLWMSSTTAAGITAGAVNLIEVP